MRVLFYWYVFLSYVTVAGWGTSAEKDQLPMRAWYESFGSSSWRHQEECSGRRLRKLYIFYSFFRYPYDTSKSPAYELTYIHQVSTELGTAEC